MEISLVVFASSCRQTDKRDENSKVIMNSVSLKNVFAFKFRKKKNVSKDNEAKIKKTFTLNQNLFDV